ncbi:MAG: M56 family metallopeptidase, partial [Tetragenococcus koreensis]|nr:M56 family metallopeptidase [Tetragenococcus koreensis]
LLKYETKKIVITPQFLYVIGILFFIRLIIPVEFGLSITIPSAKLLPPIYNVLNIQLMTLNTIIITVGKLLISIFLIGAFCKLMLLIKKSILLSHYINSKKVTKKEIINSNDKKVIVRYIKTPKVDSPSIYGIKRPVIFLPNNMAFTDKELQYITLHELTHYYKGDTLLTFLLELITCIYWWNPLLFVFKNQMNKIIELRVDNELLKSFTPTQCIEYVECLLKVKKIQSQTTEKNLAAPSLVNRHQSTFELRSKKILNFKPLRNTNRVLVIVILLLSLGSMFFVIEPYYSNPSVENTTFEVDKQEEAFFIKHDDHTFSLYINGEDKGQLDNIDEFPGGDKLLIYEEDEVK